jgi:Arc/MetJ family transcription regulator
MRTTLDLPEDLVEEAKRILGYKSKTDTIIFALKDLVRRKRIEHLKGLMGAIDLKVDLTRSRRRPAGRRRR